MPAANYHVRDVSPVLATIVPDLLWSNGTYDLSTPGDNTWSLTNGTGTWTSIFWTGSGVETFTLVAGSGPNTLDVSDSAFSAGGSGGIVIVCFGPNGYQPITGPTAAPPGGTARLGSPGAALLLSPLFQGYLPMGGQSIQSAFSISAAAGATQLSRIPPLCHGDKLDRLTLYIRGADGNTTVDQEVTVSLCLCNSRPETAAEALLGFRLLDAIALPAVPVLAGADYTHFIQVTLPLFAILDPRQIHAALVLVGISGAAISGAAFLGIERPDEAP